MKKRVLVLMMAAMAALPAFGVTAMAEEKAPVVDNVTETDPAPFIDEMSVIWYDEDGNELRQTIRPRKEEAEQDPIAGSRVIWHDDAGNTYIYDGKTVIVIPAGQ